MNWLSTFITSQLIKALEDEFMNNSPAIQEIIVEEVKKFLAEGTAWVENKISDNKTTTESK